MPSELRKVEENRFSLVLGAKTWSWQGLGHRIVEYCFKQRKKGPALMNGTLDGKCVFSVSQTDPDTQCIIAYHKHTSETAYLDTLELLSRSDGNSTHRTHKQHIFKNLS